MGNSGANINNDGDFRDKLSTVDASGKRIWLYPKKPKGRFYNYRIYLSYVLLAIMIIIPFLKRNGEPLFLFNVLDSKFILFGNHFTTQDFHIFVVAMLIGFVFIALFTVIFGRVFCGWVCPQTIFMEMVFRRIEYWIEGDANAQKRLNKAPWTSEKTFKKALKHGIFLLISVLIAHTFLSYIIGVDELAKLVTAPMSAHWSGFFGMVIFTLVFYGVFAFMREQVCTTICPYGRMQSVLLDKKSLTVAYDFMRGEPRGKIKRKKAAQTPEFELPIVPQQYMGFELEAKAQGDCIDCKLCVHVCPTGIDIRNGTQLECVNCTACMDACDEVMDKIKRPRGLIRIDSLEGITNKSHSIWNKRSIAYSLVLFVLMGLEGYLFFSRAPVEALFLRTPGMLYQDKGDGYISNLYNYQLVNKGKTEGEITFKVVNMDNVVLEYIGKLPIISPNEMSKGSIFVKIPKDQIQKRKIELEIEVLDSSGKLLDKEKTNFLSPINK